jgi:hypothetical protein
MGPEIIPFDFEVKRSSVLNVEIAKGFWALACFHFHLYHSTVREGEGGVAVGILVSITHSVSFFL